MPIKVRLEGHSKDLGFLAREFPPSSDPHVGSDGEGYYLTSASIHDDLTADTKALYFRASDLLRAVNGTARLIGLWSGFRPVVLRGDFTDAAGRMINSLGIPVDPWQPETVDLAAGYLQRAGTCPEGQQVLAILGTPEPALDWSELQKIYEIIGDHVAGGRQDRRQALTARGWVTGATLDAFTGRTMTIEGARHEITNLVLAWLGWL
jgi:hypothetical protein